MERYENELYNTAYTDKQKKSSADTKKQKDR